jgi:hypothetical protein
MGCCPCFKSGTSAPLRGDKHSYQAVPSSGGQGDNKGGSSSSRGASTAYYNATNDHLEKIDEIGEPQKPIEMNLYSNVFSGAEVLQKFHNSVQYTSR